MLKDAEKYKFFFLIGWWLWYACTNACSIYNVWEMQHFKMQKLELVCNSSNILCVRVGRVRAYASLFPDWGSHFDCVRRVLWKNKQSSIAALYVDATNNTHMSHKYNNYIWFSSVLCTDAKHMEWIYQMFINPCNSCECDKFMYATRSI